MSDADDERLAVAAEALCQHSPQYTCEKCGVDARRMLRALDAHDAAEARAGITDELVEGAAKVAWERSAGSWAHAPNVARDPYRADIRAALDCAAPLLARRAPMPAVVTEECDRLREAARDVLSSLELHSVAGWYDCLRKLRQVMGLPAWEQGYSAFKADLAALAAAPRDPQPAESVGPRDKRAPSMMTPPPDPEIARLTRRVEALEAAAQGRAYIAPRGRT